VTAKRHSPGGIEGKTLLDGTTAYELRFRARGRRESLTLHARADCDCGCGGGWDERSARRELGNILARVRAGVWTREAQHPRVAKAAADASRRIPTFHEYASYWLQARTDGVLGDKPIKTNTRADYLWRLRGHLLPFFGACRLDEIDADLCLAFKAHKIREAGDLRSALDAGADLRDARGRRVFPLGPASIRKLLDTLAAILDDAVEDGHIERNPARGKRMRLRVPKPNRSFLELDELAALIDAAAGQDTPSTPRKVRATSSGESAIKVAALLSRGLSQGEIASELGLAKSTVNWHARRFGVTGPATYTGRAFVARVLGYSGVRNTELCDMRIRYVRLHNREGARFYIPDSKTESGIRMVEMSPDLVEAFVDHLDRLRRAGHPTAPDDFVIQTARHTRITRQRVTKIIREAATEATNQRVAQGLPPLPTTTPHSLRRTYISIALLANRFDVKWVMSQVGHADSKMTLDVYAQLEQRVKREHGVRFDALVRSAQAQLRGAEMDPDWGEQGTSDSERPSTTGESERVEDRDARR
jgi:integrase